MALRPHYAPGRESFSLPPALAALREPWQFLALFIVTIGGIYAGIFSPTEAASIGAFGAILLGVLGRRMLSAIWCARSKARSSSAACCS